MMRLSLGFLIVAMVALYIFWRVLGLAFMIVKASIGVIVLVFLGYVLWLLWGAMTGQVRSSRWRRW